VQTITPPAATADAALGLAPVAAYGAGRRYAGVVALVIGIAYMVWRWGFTLAGTDLWLSLPLVISETFALVTLTVTVFTCWRLTVRDPGPPLEGRRVAVMIATYNEDMDVLRPTVIGALAIRHAGPLEVWVLDDGGRAEVAVMCAQLGAKYLSRPAPRAHAKAGNLNHGLEHIDAEFLVTLDADHVPRPHLLERTLGYFTEPRIALVQGPQSFFNRSFQHGRADDGFRNEQSTFFDVICRGKDRSNAAFWCGCPSVLRRAALMEVGGVNTTTIIEDCHTTMQLHSAGWQSVYHDEVLALGLAPEEIGAFVVQRSRWARGSFQMLRRDPPFAKRGLSWRQRLEYTFSCLYPFEGLQRLVNMLAPPVVLLTGAAAVSAPVMMIALFLPNALLSPLAIKAMTGGRYRFLEGERFGTVRMEAYLRSLSALVSRKPSAFSVTPKGARDGRPPVARALRVPMAAAIFGAVALVYQAFAQLLHLGGELRVLPLIVTSVWVTANLALVGWVFVWARGVQHRRRSHRFATELAAAHSAATDDAPSSHAIVDDLSRHGMGIVVDHCPEVGATIHSILLLDEGPVSVAGTVATVTPVGDRWRLGVELDISQQDVADAIVAWCFAHSFAGAQPAVQAVDLGPAVEAMSDYELALAETAAARAPDTSPVDEAEIGSDPVPADTQIACFDCGKRLRRDTSGRYEHAGLGPVAACDLDADHPALPDLRHAGVWSCRQCGEPAVANSLNAWRHVVTSYDTEHPPQA
jgi:cellulose synthase (UDP-forming)